MRTKLVLMLIQENGLVKRACDGEIVGQLSGEGKFDELADESTGKEELLTILEERVKDQNEQIKRLAMELARQDRSRSLGDWIRFGEGRE